MKHAGRIAVVVAAGALASVTPSPACPIIIESLWERIELADRIVLATPVCVSRPTVEVRPWLVLLAAVQEREDENPWDIVLDESETAEILSRHPELYEPVMVVDHLVVEETWKGTPVDVSPVDPLSEMPCEHDETQGARVYFESLNPEGSWPMASGFAIEDGRALVRARTIVRRAVSLQEKTKVAEWRILDWLADAIAEPATRSGALGGTHQGYWLFEGLENPPSPAEAFEARHRDAIAAGYLRDPGVDRGLPGVLRILCGHSIPALEAAVDQLARALDAAGPVEREDVLKYVIETSLESLANDCGSETASRWRVALRSFDGAAPVELVRRDLAAKRDRIVGEVLDAWERRVTGREGND